MDHLNMNRRFITSKQGDPQTDFYIPHVLYGVKEGMNQAQPTVVLIVKLSHTTLKTMLNLKYIKIL